MRVAVDMHFLQDKHQGIKTFLVGLYGAIARMQTKHEFVYIFSEADSISEHWRQHGDVVIAGNMSRTARLSWGMAHAIRRAGKIDVSHFNAVVPIGVPGKVLLTVHDILFKTHPQYFGRNFRYAQRLASAWSFRRADIIAIASQYSFDQVARFFPGKRESLCLLPDGVEIGSFERISRAAAASEVKRRFGLERFILTVGRIDPRKNHELMLRAYMELRARLPESALPQFVIVGEIDGNYTAGVRLIEELCSKNAIIWLRGIADDMLANLYVAAQFVVMASHAEGFGLPITEAMAAGVPVIAGNNTAMPEVLGDCGVLVDTNNVESITNAYLRLLTDDTLRMRLSACGKLRAKIFSWDRCAERYIEILDEWKLRAG